MNFKKVVGLTVTILALNMIILGDANAASIEVKCEKRGTSRSKISVDGNNFPRGSYKAYVISGVNRKWSRACQSTVGDEVEFDFDSNPADIAAGATGISPTFIQGGTVTGKIFLFNCTRNTYVSPAKASATARCRIR